ncbi:MAG: glycosyltransferase [Bacteroidales bacterium]|jgi:glycosyltransferase involved in cell wall biosynthesis
MNNDADTNDLPEVLVITSYPPRVCGIATYSQDLIKALNNKFSNSITLKVCALENDESDFYYPSEVKFILKTSAAQEYEKLAIKINHDFRIKLILIQHEFGLFQQQEEAFLEFLYSVSKPLIIAFHTVLPYPDDELKSKIEAIGKACKSVIVMTYSSAELLMNSYGIPSDKINIIAHGTHLVRHTNKQLLKRKYGLTGRKVLTTFGLLSSGKSIETTLEALPEIIKVNPEVLFLIIGKTHPEVVKYEGEIYRQSLESIIVKNNLSDHVRFVNRYVVLQDLLEFLQLTDMYLFTSCDPNQAVSGTFVYAMSCGCPIISTPIPHAKEVLTGDTGIIIDFRNSKQLAESVIKLFNDDSLRKNMSSNALEKIVSTVWENSAVSHLKLFENIAGNMIIIRYNLPEINLNHLKVMTTDKGIIQFSKINQPDITSGYTLDDNARALVALGTYYEIKHDEKIIIFIRKYLSFIRYCLQPDGNFFNYVDKDNNFSEQNHTANLNDANCRAIWALGYIVSKNELFPEDISEEAVSVFEMALPQAVTIHSPRAIAFALKGLYYFQQRKKPEENLVLIKLLADRLVQMYRHESNGTWQWFESYLTYANSVLPEAMLLAFLSTGETLYKDIAVSSFDFLLSQIFNEKGIEVISNRNWFTNGQEPGRFGEQPIDVAYTVMTLSLFFEVFQKQEYFLKLETAFNWFLGSNRLNQIIYNPCTGGCYDGLEETHANMNQGAESTISYLMARLTMERYRKRAGSHQADLPVKIRKESKEAKSFALMIINNKTLTVSGYYITDPAGITREGQIRTESM